MPLVTKPKKKLAPHAKKRTAQHHRKSKSYLKAYWPYIPLLAIIVLGASLNSLWSTHGNVLGAMSDFSAQTLLLDTNQERQVNNQTGFNLDSQLSSAAQAKAEDMVKTDYWSHTSPTGKTAFDFIVGSGYDYSYAGENLAYGFSNAGETIKGWMSSPEHRANILDVQYTQVGFGVADSKNYLGHGPAIIVVAEYAKPLAAAANITFRVAGHMTVITAGQLSHATEEPDTRLVSRIQILDSGSAPWALIGTSAIMGFGIALVILRHGIRLRKLLLEGEMFVAKHVLFDAGLVALVACCFLLTRASGAIR